MAFGTVRRSRLVVLVCVGLMVLASCSSSHSRKAGTGVLAPDLGSSGNAGNVAGGGTAGSPTGQGAAQGGGTGSGSPLGTSPSAGGGASPVGGASSAATGAAPSAAAAAGGTAKAGIGPASADCKQTLLIGAYNVTASGVSAAAAASLGDSKLMTTATANWINSHGGLACHPVAVIRHDHDSTSSTPVDVDDQAACAEFTEDNHVFAAVVITTATSTFYNCIAKHHTLLFMATTWNPDNQLYVDNPDLFFGVSPATDRVGLSLADGLSREHYFGGRLGLVHASQPWFTAESNAFKQEAAKLGVKVTDDASICSAPCSTTEQSSEAQNIVVRFQSEHVDHVVLFDDVVDTPYMEAEGAANYYPRIGVSSNSLPAVIALTSSPLALANAVGIGFLPATDVEQGQDVPETPAMQACEAAMRQAGQPMSNRLALQDARHECDAFFSLKAAVDKAGRPDYTLIRHAVESLGTSYAPAISWRTYFGPTRHDGVQTWRPIGFDSSCSCWRFTGGEVPFTPLPGEAE